MKRLVVGAALVMAAPVRAEPIGPCEGGVCDVDQGPRPWLLRAPCVEDHDVLGYQRCRDFGSWSLHGPDVSVEGGVGWRHVLAPPVPPMFATRTQGGGERIADLATSELRLAVGSRGLYTGVELTLGDVTGAVYPFGAFVQGGAIAGAELTLHHVVLGGELLGGARSVRLTANLNDNQAPADRSLVVEARVRGGVWVTPWLRVDAAAGAGVLDRREWSAALEVAFHSRSFAGDH